MGKFQSRLKLGTENTAGAQYRGWYYHFIAHQTGSGVRRTRYSVSICDSNHHRVGYLRDCATIQQATEAAKHWIDEKLEGAQLRLNTKVAGTSSSPPSRLFRASLAQEK